jgi:lipid II:glycine glycyltransferase (peptidoglycan interpeptide bridge formation enzyme)
VINMTGSEGTAIQSVDQAEWLAIAPSFTDYNYEQSPDYASAMAARSGADARFLVVRQGGRVLGAASVRVRTLPLVGRGLAYISGGPMIGRAAGSLDMARIRLVVAALRRHLVDEGGHLLFVRLPVGFEGGGSFDAMFSEFGFFPTRRVRSYHTVLLDLKPDVQMLRKGLAGKWRTDLNFSQRSGLSVERGASQRFCKRFLRLFAEMQLAKNFDVRFDPGFFLSLPANRTGLEILIATKEGKDAAGHVVSLLGDTAIYLFGATNEVGRETKAGYLLNWDAMLLAKAQGLAYYDLGGIDPEENPDGYRFKKRTGGREVTAAGPYEARPAGALSGIMEGMLQLRERLRRR